jgi:hypothetical protein
VAWTWRRVVEGRTYGRSRVTSSVLSPSDLGLWIVLRALGIGLTFLLDFSHHCFLRCCVRDMATLGHTHRCPMVSGAVRRQVATPSRRGCETHDYHTGHASRSVLGS